MRRIPLTQGKFALVDDKDFEYLRQWKWHLSSGGYAARARTHLDGKGSHLIFMHRVLTRGWGKKDVDHINGKKLDNRRKNLRVISHALNGHNRKVKNKNNLSGFPGVSFHTLTKKWRARVKVLYQEKHLGLFSSRAAAAKVVRKFKKKVFQIL